MIDMHTHRLGRSVEFDYEYDYSGTHSQGRPCDRAFEEKGSG